MRINFRSQERKNIKDGTKISTIYCSKRDAFGCKFYLEYRTDANTKLYHLESYWNIHNHKLGEYDILKAVNDDILNKIRLSINSVKSISELTSLINKEFHKNFHYKTIYYLVNQIKEETLGKATEDANTLVKLLEEDALKRNGFYQTKINNNNQLSGFCYMSNRMKIMLEHFSDVVIIDGSHKTNRFNMPFIDIALINNFGKTITCFISLTENQKYESFLWTLGNFKSQLKNIPKVSFF